MNHRERLGPEAQIGLSEMRIQVGGVKAKGWERSGYLIQDRSARLATNCELGKGQRNLAFSK